MNIETERKFTHTFLDKHIRERVIFELQSKKKRSHAISRFCHGTEQMVKTSRVFLRTDNPALILPTIKTLSSSEYCYIISSNEEIDGKIIAMDNALNQCIGFGWASILIVDESTAVIETEQSFGPSIEYVLHSR